MSARSLNKVMLIGNLTRDPELRYTPSGAAVCSFGLATNRSWTTEGGERKEETEFHRIVSWNKLAELCSQLLAKGKKVFVEGRLQTRSWQGQDGTQRTSTEIVIDDMIILESRRMSGEGEYAKPVSTGAPGFNPAPVSSVPIAAVQPTTDTTTPVATNATADDSSKTDDQKSDKDVKDKSETEKPVSEDINPDDIPF